MADEFASLFVWFEDQFSTAHWNYHAWFMFTIWVVFVPAVVLLTRFGKPRPSPVGIPKGSAKFGRKLFWFTTHRRGLFLATVLGMVGGIVAVVASGGFNPEVHSILGLTTITLGALQIVSAWFRGSHGGPNSAHADQTVPSSLRGDHYDMTARRRWFEAVHKSLGFIALATAFAAVATGLSIVWLPALALLFSIFTGVWILVVIVGEAKGFRYDTYLANFGFGIQHPHNRARLEELSGEHSDATQLRD